MQAVQWDEEYFKSHKPEFLLIDSTRNIYSFTKMILILKEF